MIDFHSHTRCPACPSLKDPSLKRKVVPGYGNKRARVAIILEQPGKMENNIGKPAVGKTGDELDGTYLPLAGLDRREVYVTNVVKCMWAEASDTPPQYVVDSCSKFHLERELAEVRPEVVVLAGGLSCGLLGLNLELEHGRPKEDVELLGYRCSVFPTYHPARGFHRSNDMQALLEDYRDLGLYLRGELQVPVDQYPHPSYYRLRTGGDVQDILSDRYADPCAVDTESVRTWKGYRSTIRYSPWCATFCLDAGEAFMVRVEDRDAWETFAIELRRFHKVWMHNAAHDWRVLQDSACTLQWDRIEDTMALAYHDGRLAKGLKSLAYRLLGARRRSFDDVVVPYGMEAAREYVRRAAGMEWPGTGILKTVRCKECGGKGAVVVGRGKLRTYYDCDVCESTGFVEAERYGLQSRLQRLLGDMEKDSSVNPWSRWSGWAKDRAEGEDGGEDEQGESRIDPLVAKLGAIPLPSIEMVPEREAIEYACGDAHDTFMLGPILERRLVGIRRMVR